MSGSPIKTSSLMLRASCRLWLLGVLCITLVAAALCSLQVGVLPLTLTQTLQGFLHGPDDTATGAALWLIRLPRLVLAVLIGAALAQTGAAMQGLFRNPMADPSLLGISSGSALAAAIIIVLGKSIAPTVTDLSRWLPLACFVGGVATAWVVARLATIRGQTRVATLLLAGLAINALVNAAIGLLSYLADDGALRTLTFWMFGSLGKVSWSDIAWSAPFLLMPLFVLPRYAHSLNALLLGEAEAGHLGIAVESAKKWLMFWIVLAVSVSVSLAGVIGFIGLITPHLLRIVIGPNHRLLLPASALLGSILLLCADMASRVLIAPNEVPIGILTALIGAPFFLGLLLRYRQTVEA